MTLRKKKIMNISILTAGIAAVLGGLGWFGWSESSADADPNSRIYTAEKPLTPAQLFFTPNDSIKKRVNEIYNSLTDQQKAAQMIMTASSTSEKLGYPYSKALKLVKDGYVGNVVFLKGNMKAFTSQVNEMNALNLPIKPLYACDCEPSLMNNKWEGSTPVKKANQQKTVEDVLANTAIINKDMKSVGVQLNFAPVADNSINQDVISNRAFGSNAQSIITLSKTFIKTSQDDTIATSIKHFPGHGNVKGDSHKNLVFINGELTELSTFKELIQSDNPPYTVMVGHIAIKNNGQYDTNGLPSTISRKIVTDLLRKELNYKGIITTDAMNMLGVAKVADADWKAIEAGVDLVLMPANPQALNARIVQALQNEGPLKAQIEQSIKRIILLKLILGII